MEKINLNRLETIMFRNLIEDVEDDSFEIDNVGESDLDLIDDEYFEDDEDEYNDEDIETSTDEDVIEETQPDIITIEGTGTIWDGKTGVVEEIDEEKQIATVLVDFKEGKKVRQNFDLSNISASLNDISNEDIPNDNFIDDNSSNESIVENVEENTDDLSELDAYLEDIEEGPYGWVTLDLINMVLSNSLSEEKIIKYIKENTNYDLYRVEDTQELIVSAVPEEKIYKNYFEDFDEEIKLIKI